jgi:anaerobic carbon-monoxide dehydrogenase iron sulfur subunit
MKVIGVHLDRCTGCKTCELYCAVERGSNAKTLLPAVQESPLPQSRVRVEGNNQLPIALQCRHCLQAPCLDACLTGALAREAKSNMVVVQEDRCIACWTCTLFCPYGVIYPWPERKMALKCDRCTYMENPVCVEVCPCQALELVEMGDFEEMLRQRRKDISRKLPENQKDGILLLDLD